MPLTIQQKQNISRLDADTAIEIMHECAERLGAVSVEEYCKIMGKRKRAVYYAIENKKIKCVSFADRDFPCINDI